MCSEVALKRHSNRLSQEVARVWFEKEALKKDNALLKMELYNQITSASA